MFSHTYILYKITKEALANALAPDGEGEPIADSLKTKSFECSCSLRSFVNGKGAARASDMRRSYYLVTALEDYDDIVIKTVCSKANLKYLTYFEGKLTQARPNIKSTYKILHKLSEMNQKKALMYPTEIVVPVFEELAKAQDKGLVCPSKILALLLSVTPKEKSILTTERDIRMAAQLCVSLSDVGFEDDCEDATSPWTQRIFQTMKGLDVLYRGNGSLHNLVYLFKHDSEGKPVYFESEHFYLALEVAGESFVSKHGIEISNLFFQQTKSGETILSFPDMKILRAMVEHGLPLQTLLQTVKKCASASRFARKEKSTRNQ